jgi:hypothetical protein
VQKVSNLILNMNIAFAMLRQENHCGHERGHARQYRRVVVNARSIGWFEIDF